MDSLGAGDVTEVVDGVVEFDHVVAHEAQALDNADFGSAPCQLWIGAGLRHTVGAVPIGVPVQWIHGNGEHTVGEVDGFDAGAVVAAIAPLHRVPAEVGDGGGAGGGRGAAGRVVGASLPDPIRVVESDLDLAASVVCVNGVRVVHARRAVGHAEEHNGAAPLAAHADLDGVGLVIDVFIGEAVDTGGFVFSRSCLTGERGEGDRRGDVYHWAFAEAGRVERTVNVGAVDFAVAIVVKAVGAAELGAVADSVGAHGVPGTGVAVIAGERVGQVFAHAFSGAEVGGAGVVVVTVGGDLALSDVIICHVFPSVRSAVRPSVRFGVHPSVRSGVR